MKYKRLVTVLAMLIAASAFGQSIDRVVFLQEGAYPLSEDIFEMNTQTKAGMPYSERIVNEDVRRLFALGMFADVYSEVKDLSNGNKEVIFNITAKKNVSEISIKGNRKFSDSELMKLVKLHTDMPLNDALQIESTRELRKFYDEKGYTDAQIDSSLEADGDNSVKVIFNIAEHLRVRIDNVEFEGMEVYKPSEVKDLLETRYFMGSAKWLSFMPWTFLGLPPNFGLYDKDFISRDKIRLRELYWQKGYLDFKVTDVVVTEHEDDPELVDVKFVVEEGDPYFINSIRIIGAKEFPEEELLPLLSAREEEVYSSSREDRDLKVLESKYSPLGYADFQARAVHYPDYSTHSVDVEYEIHEGTQFTIGEVYISGNRMTKDYVIRRELPFETDDPMDMELLDIGKSRLMGMGYFQSANGEGDGVEILSMDSPEPGKKDIYVNVEEKDFYGGNLGFGWSDSDGLAGSIQLWHSNMDITDPMNLFTGGGQRLRIGALVGVEHFDVQTDFTEPYLFGIPLRFDLSGYWREVLYEDWNEQRLGFTVSLTKRIFDEFTSVTGGYTFEYVRVLDMNKKMGPIFQDAKGGERVGRVFLALNRDTRNSATNPTSGYDIGAYTYLTSRGLGASNDYYKFELRAVNYFPFLHDWFVLTTGAKIGTMGTFNGDMVPLYDRYFLGGGDSVRGFPYRSIGPVDNNNDNYGGEFMYLFTAELSHPIYKFLRGAVFCDVGDATSAHFGPINQPNVGVGYGLRIMVPGINMPIRLDLAYPIVCNQEGVSRKLRFHFNMGFSFSPLGR
ncbi:MAG: outer membrane protein assembly factor BamA [Lentisphaeria bacterium]|nr:outer membrane protein assembly factor BamA [Lentisphaeria bacterium]